VGIDRLWNEEALKRRSFGFAQEDRMSGGQHHAVVGDRTAEGYSTVMLTLPELVT
jgi:hypothetical protein